nr:cell adhesion molecule [Hymenolepis microstoma]
MKLKEKLNQPLISLRNLDDPTFPPRQITSTDCKKTVLSLKPSTYYSLTVFGKDPSNGKSEISREYRFRTPSDRPSKLQKIEIQKIGPREVTLNWLPPAQTNERIQGYMVMYTFDNHFWAIKKTPNLRFNIIFEETVKKITALVAAYTGPNEGDLQGGGMGKISQITLALNSTGKETNGTTSQLRYIDPEELFNLLADSISKDATDEDLLYPQERRFERETNADKHGSGSRQSDSSEPNQTALGVATTENPNSMTIPYQTHSNGDALEILNRTLQLHSDNEKDVATEFDNEPKHSKIQSESAHIVYRTEDITENLEPMQESAERIPFEYETQMPTTEIESEIGEELASKIEDSGNTGETSSDFTTTLDLISTDEISTVTLFKQREEKISEETILSSLVTDSTETANNSEAHALKLDKSADQETNSPKIPTHSDLAVKILGTIIVSSALIIILIGYTIYKRRVCVSSRTNEPSVP